MRVRYQFAVLVASAIVGVCAPSLVSAATLKLAPNTGVYAVGGTFSARVTVDTAGKPINAAEGTLSYNSSELTVLSVSKNGSIFGLWTIEPTFSGGKITFGGGSPSGYTGGNGTVVTITFKALKAGSPKVSFTSGSVLAADGQGTNVLTNMTGGSYTVSAAASTPEPEKVIEKVVEYVPPPNTPKAPIVTSTSHPKESDWYTVPDASLSWAVPAGVVAVRTALDSSPSTIPTIVYDTPIREKLISDLPEGTSYFHVQFKNEEGWGKVTHYRLNKDTEKPTVFSIAFKDVNADAPKRTLVFTVADAASGVDTYRLKIDNGETLTWKDEKNTHEYELPALPPGEHTLVGEAVDKAGNSLATVFTFTVESFEAPKITDYPQEITESVIPVIKGTTRPRATVTIHIQRAGMEGNEAAEATGDTKSNDNGEFIYVAPAHLSVGTYEVTAQATDEYGRMSAVSEPVRIAVQEPGYVRFGSFMVSALSVVVPLIALMVLLVLVVLWGIGHARRLRHKALRETFEAERVAAKEFHTLIDELEAHLSGLESAKKNKLTRGEATLIESLRTKLAHSERKVKKEIEDIAHILK